MEMMIKMFKEFLNDASNLKHPRFPLYLHMSEEQDYWFSIIPKVQLVFHPINPIRIVSNELYKKLASKEDCADVGYMSIDQSRQLFLLSHNDSVAYQIPLIGM